MHPTNEKPKFSLTDLSAGLHTLNVLWKRGMTPLQVRAHLFLTWYILNDGNLTHTSNQIDVQRFNLWFYFLKHHGKKGLISFRRYWQNLLKEGIDTTFETRFYRLWVHSKMGPIINELENKKLIRLWKTGFPFKMLLASFLLWAMRNQKPLVWIHKQMGVKDRSNFIHYRKIFIKQESQSYYWLAPLKPTENEWKRGLGTKNGPVKRSGDLKAQVL